MPIILSNKIIDLAQKIITAGIKITTAESCTGGLIAGIITAIPGSSTVFDRGFVVYSNQAKIEMLGVRDETIKKHGAVSSEAAIAMAIGAINNSEAEISLSVTGIAGPSGGSPEKPVGLVHFATCRQGQILHHAEIFIGDRDQVREQAIETGLKLILQAIDL